MSVAYFSQVMRLRLSDPTEKLVLLAFAEHANEDGLTFPSVDLVAAEALCSGRTVQRIIQRFTDAGLLRFHKRASGRGYPTCYRVDPWAIGDVPGYDELRERQRTGSHPTPARRPSERPEDHPQADLLDEKGDTLVSPITEPGRPQKGDRSDEKGDKFDEKGDTLVSPEPLTYNQTERADARPVDNSRPDRPRDKQERADARRLHDAHPQYFAPNIRHETPEQVAKKAQAHAIEPRQKWEDELAFHNRVACQTHTLAVNQNEARRLRIGKRRPDETVTEFEHRVSVEALKRKGIDLSTPPDEARRQALKTR